MAFDITSWGADSTIKESCPKIIENFRALKEDGISVPVNIDAAKITTGVLDIARIPAAALERLTQVADQAARFALTVSIVQQGDSVKQLDTGTIYIVVDISNLGNENGYKEYTAGTAAAVPWSGVTDKPTSIDSYGITDAYTKTTSDGKFLPFTGGNLTGAINEALVQSMALASTMAIGAAAGNYIIVTAGTGPITSFDSIAMGARRFLRFSVAATIIYNAATMLLPGAANLNIVAGDVLEFVSGGGGIWRCINIQRWNDDVSGNAATTTKLATARALSITGDATGTTSFDGSTDVNTVLTLADSGITTGTYRSVTVDTKGRVTAGSSEAYTASEIANVPSGGILSEDVQAAINELADLATIGYTGYIADGFKITPETNLAVNISSGRANVGEKLVNLVAAQSLTLTQRKAALLYLSSAGVVGAINTADPTTFIDDNTVAMWIFNQTDAGVVPNSAVGVSSIAVANNLTPSGGLTSVDGWGDYAIKGDGSTGYYSAANTTNFPTGATQRQIDVLLTFSQANSTTQQYIYAYGTASAASAFGLYIDIDNTLWVYVNGSANNKSTGYVLTVGETYLLSSVYDGAYIKLYINGSLVLFYAVTLTTALGLGLIVLRTNASTAYFSYATVHYVEIRNAYRTAVQIGAIANKLCLPCQYIGYSASYPTISDADKATAWHEWKFDETSGATVADSAGTLNGTATGTTIVDSEIGLGKTRKFSNTSDLINCGSLAIPNTFTMIFVGTVFSYSALRIIFSNRNAGVTSGNFIAVNSSGIVSWASASNSIALGTDKIITNKPIFIAVTINGTSATLYQDSPYTPNKVTVAAPNTTASVLYLGYDISVGANYTFNGNMDYFSIIPRELSQAEIAVIYNAIMNQKTRTIIDDVIPSNGISLGFARTNTSSIIEIDDSSYKTGRREGAFGGNRKQFLGWKYFSGSSVTLSWSNPFATRKVKTYFTWAQDANGTNETPCMSRWFNGTLNYGIYAGTHTTASDYIRAVITSDSGGVAFNNVWQTSGYIGCYVEVIE